MECPHCNGELEHHDTYFLGRVHTDSNKLGDIYKCPNSEGFATEFQARQYEAETLTAGEIGADDWQDIVCHSAVHYVSGSFYTDRNGNLHEGYPC